RSKSGMGIVPIHGVVCTGCHMILPANFVNEVRQADRIVFCPYCSRILFYEETENEQAFEEILAGSLSDLSEDESEESEDMDNSEEQEEGLAKPKRAARRKKTLGDVPPVIDSEFIVEDMD
ncbi:MAG: C4-type zinc ribbon domain-containing protein, partial [Rectinemataceae bacterium]